MPEQRGKPMKLKVLACRQVYSSTNPRGDRYTIYEVDAESPQGTRINHKLRSFEELPLGQLIDVTVTKFVSETHGESYTLHLTGRNGASTQKQLNDLAEKVEELIGHNRKLLERQNTLEEKVRSLLGQRTETQPADSSQPGTGGGW